MNTEIQKIFSVLDTLRESKLDELENLNSSNKRQRQKAIIALKRIEDITDSFKKEIEV